MRAVPLFVGGIRVRRLYILYQISVLVWNGYKVLARHQLAMQFRVGAIHTRI